MDNLTPESAAVRIPSFGFARGVVVRQKGSDRNMIVVRGLDETTACVVVEGDAAGNLRLREYPTDSLVQMRIDDGPIDPIVQERDDLKRTFDLQWRAQMCAIRRWQAATGKDKTWPDHADLVVWLLEQLDTTSSRLATAEREARVRGLEIAAAVCDRVESESDDIGEWQQANGCSDCGVEIRALIAAAEQPQENANG